LRHHYPGNYRQQPAADPHGNAETTDRASSVGTIRWTVDRKDRVPGLLAAQLTDFIFEFANFLSDRIFLFADRENLRVQLVNITTDGLAVHRRWFLRLFGRRRGLLFFVRCQQPEGRGGREFDVETGGQDGGVGRPAAAGRAGVGDVGNIRHQIAVPNRRALWW